MNDWAPIILLALFVLGWLVMPAAGGIVKGLREYHRHHPKKDPWWAKPLFLFCFLGPLAVSFSVDHPLHQVGFVGISVLWMGILDNRMEKKGVNF